MNQPNKEPEIKNYYPKQFPDEVNLKDVTGYPKTVSTAPTYTPKTFIDGFVMYSNGGTYRLYIYDFSNKAWRYATLT